MRKGRVGALLGLAAALAMVVAALGCREPAEPRRPAGLVANGDLSVTMSTTGEGIPSGYTLEVRGPGGYRSERIGANATATFSGLVAGDYTVSLAQPPSNCLTGADLRTVPVPAGGAASTTFSISCTAIGDLVVTTSTTGTGIPPDYALDILRPDGSSFFSWRIGANETLTFPETPPGDYTVALGAPANCTVSGVNRRTVTVRAGGADSTTFSVSCRPGTGDLRVQTYTTGAGIPPDYQLDISGPGFLKNERIGPNVYVPFNGIPSGDYTVTLGVPPNCTVSGANPSTVTVPAGSINSAIFSVRCIGNGDGHLSVTTSTTGTDTAPDYGPEPYSFAISAPGFFWDGSLGRNATVPLSGVPSGDYTVSLGVPPNCPVSGANPRIVTVPAGGTASTTFSMNCWTRGVLFVSTSTTGTGIPATYSLDISGPRRLSMSIDPNVPPGTLWWVIPVGDYTMALGVPANCTVSGDNPRTVTVPVPDGTDSGRAKTTFSVSCTAAGT
jgi:hypothetical protein